MKKHTQKFVDKEVDGTDIDSMRGDLCMTETNLHSSDFDTLFTTPNFLEHVCLRKIFVLMRKQLLKGRNQVNKFFLGKCNFIRLCHKFLNYVLFQELRNISWGNLTVTSCKFGSTSYCSILWLAHTTSIPPTLLIIYLKVAEERKARRVITGLQEHTTTLTHYVQYPTISDKFCTDNEWRATLILFVQNQLVLRTPPNKT